MQDVNEISLTLSSIEMLSVILTRSQCFEVEIPKVSKLPMCRRLVGIILS